VSGKSYTWAAGVLPDIDAFDARFFGISPREAAQVDPQQRILLELAWEALEDAGRLPQSLAGSDCGVYVGISNMDYINSRQEDPSSGDAYIMTGGVLSIAANRISHFLGLHGPSMSIDTACSSSLVAVHQACKSIAVGECDTALVGGVNVLLTPYPFIGFSNASMLSPTGRCHAFDASADGYVRAEGGAMLVLKTLDQARADGDPVRAIIVASGTNSDGRTSGLSLPNESAQKELLRTVYARAGLEPGELRYIEAHGTGTAVGDPIEASAIGQAVAMARDHDDPLLIGSVKTNIGHLEPAAGVAGLLKVILSLENDFIPPSRNFNTPNPNIRFDDLNLRVVTRAIPITNTGFSAAMGVNSFGFGGTNAHVVVRKHVQPRSKPMSPGSTDRHAAGEPGAELAQELWKVRGQGRFYDALGARSVDGRHAFNKTGLARESKDQASSIPLILSAQTPDGLIDAARATKCVLEKNPNSLYDICDTAAKRRQRFDHQLAVFGSDASEMAARLDNFVARKPTRGAVSGQSIGRPAKLALLFSGNGAQWQGMGCRLLQQDPVFGDWVRRVDALFHSMSGVSLLTELHRRPEESSLHLTEIAQPALFAVQIGMFESLIARGLEPGAVFGHSVGEVAAAYACGAYTLEQATRVIHERSRAQAKTRGQGKIAAVGLPAAKVREEIARLDADLEIGGYNSPSSVTVAGSEAQLEILGEAVKQQGALFRVLDLDYPFHTRAMDALQKDLVAALYGLNAFKTRLPFVSTVTGSVLDSEYLDADYWWQNVRKPVRLDKAMATLIDGGFQVFMEISPHSILQGYVLENLNGVSHAGSVVPTCRRDRDDGLQLMEALCTAHVLGCELDLGKLFPVHGEFVRLPHYPWQREKIWFERTSETFGLLKRTAEHPLLGYRMPQMEGVWEKEMDVKLMPWLGDHVVGGTVVFPAAAFIEMALAVSAVASTGASPAIEYLKISTPLVFTGGATRRVRFVFTSDDGRFSIQSRPRLSTETWIIHVTGRLTRGSAPAISDDLQSVNADAPTTRVDAEAIYGEARRLGLQYGEFFKRLDYVDFGPGFALARIKGKGESDGATGGDGYRLHPARLDACFHGLIGLARAQLENTSNAAFIPVHTGRVVYAGDCDDFTFARIHLTKVRPRSISARFELLDGSMRPVAVLQDVRFRCLQLNQDSHQTLPAYEHVALPHYPERLERAGTMPSLKSLASVADTSLTARNSSLQRGKFIKTGLPASERLAASFAAAAVGKAAGGDHWTTRHQLAAALEVSDTQRTWFNQLLKLLEDAEFIERENGRIRFASVPSFEQVQSQWRNLLAEFPAYHAELTLTGRCGLRLNDLLTGAIEYDALIDDAGLARLRAAFPGFRSRDGALRELLRHLANVWSDPRPLRVLEVGLEGDPPDVRLREAPNDERVEHVYASCRRNSFIDGWKTAMRWS
jgi:acyl transferase domain-containing protein